MAVPGYFPVYYFPGLLQEGGASCDYPSVGDVQLGVQYGFGALTGTFVVPTESDVAAGISYGAGGTEFLGTLSCSIGPFDPPAGNWPNQAASYEQILDALQIQIMKYTGLGQTRVREWYSDERPTFGDDPCITYRPTFENPFKDAGAGRLGTKTDFGIRVTVWFRLQSDDAGTHRLWGRQVLNYRRLIVSALHDHMLFDEYDSDGDPLEDATPLLYKVIQYTPSDVFDKKAVMTDGKAVMDFVGGAVLMVHVPNLVS